MMRSIVSTIAVVALLAIGSFGSRARASSVDGVIGLTPVLENSCVAVTLSVTPGQSVSGLSWYNNDEHVVFPHVLVLEGGDFGAPDLGATALVEEDVVGASSAWSTLTFATPFVVSGELLTVVFELPANSERTGTGEGGGPGIGYRSASGQSSGHVSTNGVDWTMLAPTQEFAVDLVFGLARGLGSGSALSDLAPLQQSGWWSDLRATRASQDDGDPAEAPEENSRVASPSLAVSPSPFNPRTEISFSLASRGNVSVSIVDVRGRRVRTLVNGIVAPGQHAIVWDGTDGAGQAVSSGVYFIRVATDDWTSSKRAVLVR